MNTGFNNRTLILGASTANAMVTLSNDLALGAFLRTVQVDNGSALDDGKLSGAITGGVGGGLTKTGDGALRLDGNQTYATLNADAGTTNVNGSLTTGTAAVTVSNVGTTLRFGSVSQTLSSLTIGAGSTVIFTSGTASGSLTGGGGKAAGFGSPASSFGPGASGSTVPEPGTIGLLLVKRARRPQPPPASGMSTESRLDITSRHLRFQSP